MTFKWDNQSSIQRKAQDVNAIATNVKNQFYINKADHSTQQGAEEPSCLLENELHPTGGRNWEKLHKVNKEQKDPTEQK